MKTKNSVFQFRNPTLEELSFVNNADFVFTRDSVELSTRLNTYINRREEDVLVTIQLEVGERTEEQPFYVFLRMSALFRWGEDLEEDEAESMLKTTAPSLLVSYARPIIANVTGWSQRSPFNLPFLDLTKNEAEDEAGLEHDDNVDIDL